MSPIHTVCGLVVPLDRENIDTDAIMPKQFLTSTSRTGYGAHLFDAWRFLDTGAPGQDPATRIPNPDFPLNQPRYQGARVLLARDNFGCGSSREHAPWGLLQFGIGAVLAPSFGDIFANNAWKNGLLAIRLEPAQIDALFGAVAATPGLSMSIDLGAQTVTSSDHRVYRFEMDPFRKRCLQQGEDDIGLALAHALEIHRHEEAAQRSRPWAFMPVHAGRAGSP
jgi:3-isopropylmalate/(R)-2-methylmalate dehydratase small subunit